MRANTKVVEISNANVANIGELKGLLANSRQQGLTVAIINMPVKFFAIDPGYQTDVRTERDLDYLVKEFDENKLLPLTAVPHDEEGKVYIVDGYGRWKASQIVDAKKYTHLQCMVILNAPKDKKERQKYEALQYAFQNKNVAKMRPIHKHGALQILEDSGVLAMDKMQEKYGFNYTMVKGQREGGVLGSYAETYDIAARYGIDCLDYIFSICEKAGFDRKANGYGAYVMRGLRDIWKYYPNNRKETAEFLGAYLRRYEPVKFKANAVSRYLMLDPKTATSLYLEDLIVDNIALSHRRKVEGRSVTEIKTA